MATARPVLYFDDIVRGYESAKKPRLLIALLCALVVVAIISACGGSGDDDTGEADATATASGEAPAATVTAAAGDATATPAAGGSEPTLPPPTITPSDPIPDDWLSYTDPVFGFSFRYPADLVFEDRSPEPGAAVLYERILDYRSASDQQRAFTFSVSAVREGTTAGQWARENTACDAASYADTAIDGAASIICTADERAPAGAAAIKHGDKVYWLISILEPGEFSLILASLRLTGG
jgi:hypothetical protein